MNKIFQYHFGCAAKDLGETVIISPFMPLDKFKEHCEVRLSFNGRVYSGITGRKGTSDITVVHCGIGDRLMGDAVLLLEHTAVRRIIFVGACGGLKGLGIGDLLVCENAFDGEGFTKYHKEDANIDDIFAAGTLVPSDPGYSATFYNFLEEKLTDISVKKGDIFTIGSLLAESEEVLIEMEEKGFSGIEMELSAVFQAARKIERKATGLLYVSDLPKEKPLWEKLTSDEKKNYNKAARETVRLVVEFAGY